MKFIEKLLILLVAVIVSALGFHLISSPFVGLHTMAKETDNEKIENFLVIEKPFQITHLSPSDCNTIARRPIGASK
jgi:hypothetical protein